MSMVATLQQLVSEADLVMVARTVSTFSHYDEHGRIVTDVELWVEQTEKGDAQAGQTLVLRRLGGVVDGIGMQVVGEPVFVEGERQLLFARLPFDTDIWQTVAMSQGRMRLIDVGGETWVEPGGEGLTMFEHGVDGRLKRAGFASPRRFADLLGEVRALVARSKQ